MVMVVTVLTCLLILFTLSPWLASRIGKSDDLKPTNFFNRFLLWFESQLDRFIEWYGERLDWVLRHKLIFIGFVILLFVGTAAMMHQAIIGQELMSAGDRSE